MKTNKTISAILFFGMVSLLFILSSFSAFAAEPARAPRIVDTVYPTRDVIVADIVLTDAPYAADPTGKTDCSPILQKAIDDLYAAGGGTVFLPVGSYRLCSGITIRPFVTVAGDWQDPDEGTDYGTLIIADVPSSPDFNPALFNVGGSAGAIGLTVWYPNQSIDNVVPYPYTFYVDGAGANYMLQTVRNCTMLNSYRGIGVCTEWKNDIYQCHEMLTVENVKGTCLCEGLSNYNSADVDLIKSFHISGRYWAESGEKFNAPALSALNAYTKKNLAAFVLGDLEWPELCDLSAEHCRYGIYLAVGPRAAFSATFFDISLTDCEYGIFAEEGAVMVRQKQWGYSLCNSVIEGDKAAVYDRNKSVVMLTNTTVKGKLKGKNIHTEKASTGQYTVDYNKAYTKPASVLYVVDADKTGRTDASAAVADALSAASATGGIVYLPAGVYRFDGPVTVPAGVELRGAGLAAGRCLNGCSNGTLILSYYGYCNVNRIQYPLITLAGSNSGLMNIRINYPLNCPRDESGGYIPTMPAVSVTGNGTHLLNNMVVLSSVGFSLENAGDAYLSRNVGCCIGSFIHADGCEGLFIEGCLQNGNCLPRNGYFRFGIPETDNWLTEDRLFDCWFIPISRIHTDFLHIENSRSVTVLNTFIYGGRRFLLCENSEIFLCNVGCDGQSKDYYTYTFVNSDAAVIGTMKSTFDGKSGWRSYEADKATKLKIYDRISVDLPYNEFTVLQNCTPEGDDLPAFLLQPFYRLIEILGKIFVKK